MLSFPPWNGQLLREMAPDAKAPKGINRGRAHSREAQGRQEQGETEGRRKRFAEAFLRRLENLLGILQFSSEEKGQIPLQRERGLSAVLSENQPHLAATPNTATGPFISAKRLPASVTGKIPAFHPEAVLPCPAPPRLGQCRCRHPPPPRSARTPWPPLVLPTPAVHPLFIWGYSAARQPHNLSLPPRSTKARRVCLEGTLPTPPSLGVQLA